MEILNKLFKYMDSEHEGALNDYIVLAKIKGYYSVKKSDFINADVNYDDCSFLREYSGYNYKHINNALRGRWNYEENGHIDNKERFIKDGYRLEKIIENNPSYVDKDFRVFRGVTLSYFDGYKLNKDKDKKNEIKDLVKLNGQYIFDSGFVSTSIKEEDCFFKKNNELGLNYNVMIIYWMPAYFDDGIFLYGDMTYSEGQNEYLINKGNLAYVSKVIINENEGTAKIFAVMIPKKVYYESYNKHENGRKSR